MFKHNDPTWGMIRVEVIEGTPWFYAADICREIGHKNHSSYYTRKQVNEKSLKKLNVGTKHGTLVVDMLGALDLIEGGNLIVNERAHLEGILNNAGEMALEAYRNDKELRKAVEEMQEVQQYTEEMKDEKSMDAMQIFQNPEFGEIRTEIIDGEPWFCLSDVCKALELTTPSKVKERLNTDGVNTIHTIDSMSRNQEALFINELNLYKTIFQSRKESAERFTDWVAGEVLPTLRKSYYQKPEPQPEPQAKPLTALEQIKLIATGTTELAQQVATLATDLTKTNAEVTELKTDMPLYGCEIDEVQQHVKRKGVQCLGGKDSEAYADGSIRSQVYKDIYSQLKREYGCVSTYKSIKRKYIADVHDFIDCYQLPTVLEEQITAANAQQRLF